MSLLQFLLPTSCVGCGNRKNGFCNGCRTQLQKLSNAALLQRQVGFLRLPVVSCALYKGVAKNTLLAYKYADRPQLAKPLGQLTRAGLARLPLSGQTPPMLVPLPSSRAKIRSRGWNHLQLLLKQAGARKQLIANCMLASKSRQTQAGLNGYARIQNAQQLRLKTGSLQRLANRQVWLFDDVCTTGATVLAAATTLQDAGIPVAGAFTLFSVPLQQANSYSSGDPPPVI